LRVNYRPCHPYTTCLKKILIVEDDADTLEIVEDILRSAGYAVIKINREITIEEISSIKPNLVIVDFFLPHRLGNEICNEIKETPETKHMPVILYSASNLSPKVIKACKADAFIPKPFYIDYFIDTVNLLAS
jgi:two-component system response regulator VicR